MHFDIVGSTVTLLGGEWAAPSRRLQFDAIAKDRDVIEIGSDYVVGSNWFVQLIHASRQILPVRICVTDDPKRISHIKGDRPICGYADFHECRASLPHDTPAAITIELVTDSTTFEAMLEGAFHPSGVGEINLAIEGLGYGTAPDGSHHIWDLADESDCGFGMRRRISEFSIAFHTHSTTQSAINRLEERLENERLLASPYEGDRKIAGSGNRPTSSERQSAVLLQIRSILVLMLLAIASILFVVAR